MFGSEFDLATRVRDVEGNVPLAVVMWLEHHPTGLLASALASTASNVRWLFRVSGTLDVVLRGPRVEVVDSATGTRVGSARIQGARSAIDFDALPKAAEPPPFLPPDVTYPALFGFACDLEGRVARFQPPEAPNAVGPGLSPRATSYPHREPKIDEFVGALSVGHDRPSYPITAFAARVSDLVRVLGAVSGTTKVYSWFEDDRVVIWPVANLDVIIGAISALHAKKACLGCSRNDPRDVLGRGTYWYTRGNRSGVTTYSRDDLPDAAS